MASKTVLITGATRGIGLTFVEHYVTSGWKVIAAARNLETAEKLRALKPYKIVQLDVSDEDSIVQVARDLDSETVDVLINNAGVLWLEMLNNTKKSDLMTQFEINAVGPFLVTRAFREHLKRSVAANGVAKVLNISSVLGSIASNNNGGMYGYRASKAALNMINQSLALDMKSDNITTIVCHPGYVSTEMNSYQGTVQPKDSVAGLTKVIENASIEDSGKFFDYSSKRLPW
jgi:NAD(P)-dependent dehydrogenase (short-subunit alcohol dehydrogenase family)